MRRARGYRTALRKCGTVIAVQLAPQVVAGNAARAVAEDVGLTTFP